MILSYELHYIQREIKTHGEEYTFYRKRLDQYKQDTGETEEVATVRGLYHTEKGYVTETSGDYGKTRTRGNPKLLIMFDQIGDIQKNDIVVVNGNVYNVVDLNNVAELNVVYDLSLEVVLDGYTTST